MGALQRSTFYVLSAVILVGTLYSIIFSTFMDTSDPLLTHLPHHLSDTHYFACKRNWLNVYFLKKAWGWTSIAFLLTWLTGHTKSPAHKRANRTENSRLLFLYVTLTLLWVLFTNWFFGPALLDRVVLASGGECLLTGPPGIGPLSIPVEHCFSRSKISAQSHPELFQSLFKSPNGDSFTEASICPPDAPTCIQNILGVPRLRNGHDVSGHLFLLTMSILLLTRQLEASFERRNQTNVGKDKREVKAGWSQLHTLAVIGQFGLLALWLLASVTTSVYFHSPGEKLTGLVLGVATYATAEVLTSIFFPTSSQAERLDSVAQAVADKTR